MSATIARSPTPLDAHALFARHLDLAPLRGRARGLVRCVFHDDPSASLSLDVDRGLFHCFGCGVGGGFRRFAELVGESPRRDSDMVRTSAPARSLLQEARRRAAEQAEREGARAAEWAPWHHCAGFIRRSLQAVDEIRGGATALGPEHPRTWAALALAARVEDSALAIEAELDAILASGRMSGERSLESIVRSAGRAA
jgi:hypothetical protein